MTELEKMQEFVDSGRSAILSDFWDWLEQTGFRLVRDEDATNKLDCPNVRCHGGFVTIDNPDPLRGWTTSAIPDTLEVECERCGGNGFVIRYLGRTQMEWRRGPEMLFAMYAGIDLDKLERERRSLWLTLRSSEDEMEDAE